MVSEDRYDESEQGLPENFVFTKEIERLHKEHLLDVFNEEYKKRISGTKDTNIPRDIIYFPLFERAQIEAMCEVIENSNLRLLRLMENWYSRE